MPAAQLVIEIVAKATDAAKGLDSAANSAGKFQRGVSKAAGVAAVGLVAVAGAAMECAQSAARTQEAFGGLDAVFGDSAGQMKAWAGTAADSMGLSKAAYAEGATAIGGQLKALGMPMDQVGSKTNDLMQTAADLAATYGGETSDAVAALGSAMRGEADPAEKYNLQLKQSAINAQMAADGTDKLTGKARETAKMQAILKLVTEQSADAHGQFKKESDGASGSAKVAAANFENAKDALGQALLPTLTKVAKVLANVAKWVQENSTVVMVLVGVLATLAVAIMLVNLVMWLMAANPIVLMIVGIVAAVVLLVAGFVLLWNKCEAFRNAIIAVWNAAKAGAAVVAAAFMRLVATVANVAARIKAAFMAVWNWLKAQASGVTNFIKGAFAKIAGPIAAIANRIKSAFNAAFNLVKSAARSVSGFIKSAFAAVAGPIVAVANRIKSAFVGAFNSLKSAARSAVSAVKAPFNAIKGAIEGAIGAVGRLIDKIRNIKMPSIKIPGLSKSASAAAPMSTTRSAVVPLAGTRANTSTSGGGVVINVNGALDPEAVARQIRTILNGAAVRRQGVILAART